MRRLILAQACSLALLGCATPQIETQTVSREPAMANVTQETPRVTYKKSYNCPTPLSKDLWIRKPRWSALSGFQVGPAVGQYFNSPEDRILRPFTSDSCSVSPDGLAWDQEHSWVECCIRHDFAYWLGGTPEDKERADDGLADCMESKGYPKIGWLYHEVVDKFGGPNSGQAYRWGYGWNYQRPFGELSASEEAQITLLYGVTRDELPRVLFTGPQVVTLTCNTFDVVFFGFSDQEKFIYQFLNQNLQRNTVIEWVRIGRLKFNGEKDFFVKLEGCEDPLVFSLAAASPQNLQLKNQCPDLLEKSTPQVVKQSEPAKVFKPARSR